MVDNYQKAIDAAVSEAKDAYEQADVSPIDHGFAHIEGIDGRTSLGRALKAHPKVDADDTSYITIDGVSRYLTPQQAAYRAFLETLEEHDIDHDAYVRGRLD
jgi:hypothetical protein